MAIKINFDTGGRPEVPTFILSEKNGYHVGVLSTISQIHVIGNLNSFSEFSFSIYKVLNEEKCEFWDDIDNFHIIYIPEWKKWFEIYVEIDEKDSCVKNVTAKTIQEAELSQILLFEIEINTEKDIEKDDYVPTVLFERNNAKASLLHRLLADKAQHYKIIHVDDTIAKKQRSFSFDNTSIHDAFQEISEELHCLFVYGEEDGSNGIPRTISVYDLESNCNNCGYRGEYMGVCPECGSLNIDEGYGEDTTIFVSNENLAEGITFSTDTDSVKNCFRLEAGDDDMTAAVVNINPSGNRYIWYIPDYMKKRMSKGLVEKIDAFNKQIEYYEKTYQENLDPTILNNYNQLIDKYKVFKSTLDTISTPIKGYYNLMKNYYDVIDFKSFLETTLMPSPEISKTSTEQQTGLLTAGNLSPVSVENTSYISLATANSVILSYARVFIDTARYKVKVKSSSLSGTTWTGSFTVVNYADEEDTADSASITIQINNNYENFVKQKIDKILTKENEDISIIGLFKKADVKFKTDLKKYGLSSLQIIHDACQSCLDILIEQGISSMKSDLYEKIYKPYRNKLTYISQEMKLRESEIMIVDAAYDKDGFISKDGMKSLIQRKCREITKILDFKKYLGDYWNEFCTFRREDSWKNTNYISEGLDNAQLFKQAKEFLDSAKKDLIKSATQQHSISTTLKNLLVMEDFKPLVEHFAVGNWLRISIDEKVYKLRLISYEIDYDNLDIITVEFSDVVDVFGLMKDIKDILEQSKSMSGSFDSIKHQAEEGEKASGKLKGWVGKGLEATTVKIMNNSDDQDYVFDRHGMVFRKKDPDSDTYSPIQMKIINSTLAMTTDDWLTSKVAVGEYIYLDPRDWRYKTGYGVIADTLIGNLILGEEVGIYNDKGTMTFKEDGLTVTNDINTFKVNPNSKTLLTLSHNDRRILYVDETGELHISGDGSALDITANGTISGINTKITQNAEAIVLEANRATKAEGDLSSSIKVNADNIALEVKRATDAEGTLSTQLSVQADEIKLRVTNEEVDSIIEQKADSIRMKADKISWDSTYSSMTENGVLTCEDAYVSGTVFCGRKYGLWVKMDNSGKITGGLGSNQRGYIDYSAVVDNVDTEQTWEGIQIQGGVLRISVNEFATKKTSDIHEKALVGATGDYTFVYNINCITDEGGHVRNINWDTMTLHFENGILVSQI